MEKVNNRSRVVLDATEMHPRLRFGETDLRRELEYGLAQLSAIHLAVAEIHLTPAQHKAFVAFMREVTVQSLGFVE